MKALIMAGGKGTRLNASKEKPLIKIDNNCLIEYIIESLQNAKNIDCIYVAISDNTPNTIEYLKSYEEKINVILTQGKGYHEDMKEAINNLSLYEPVLVVPSDIMFVSSQFLDKIIKKYSSQPLPALSVYIKEGVSPTFSTKPFLHKGKKVISAGINIIDGRYIDRPYQEEYTFFIDKKTNILNINTPEELNVAKILLQYHPQYQIKR